MENLAEHPTVKHFYEERMNRGEVPTDQVLDAAWLRQLCLDAGADDVGFVERDRPEIADQKADIENVFPRTRTLISVVCRMNRENIRTPARSVSNLEFHHTTDETNEVARRIVTALQEVGTSAINGGAVGFPMEADRWGSKMWVISHKPVAVAAGLGQMGIHRNVIHPKFGNFILLGTVLVDAEISEYSHPVVYNPCLKIADSKSALDYREKVSGAESVSMWQSLSFGANYKAAYCLSVCPAGEDVIAPFLTDRKEFLKDVVKPLQDKTETIYVVPGSDAEDYVARRFPHKKTKRVSNGLAGQGTIRAFLRGLNFVFQKGQSKGLNAVYHFTFTGHDEVKATVTIRDEKLQVSEGHNGQADLRLTADSQTWLRFLRKEANLVWALLRRKIRIQGSPKLLLAFGRCFPS